MKERTSLIIRLIATHIILIPVFIAISCLVPSNIILAAAIIQISTLIIFLTGYWEFFTTGFRTLYVLLIEILLLIRLIRKFVIEQSGTNSHFMDYILLVLLIWLVYEFVKILIVIFRSEKEVTEIYFPFRNGKYMITDGGNSKISRLMNYHFYSKVHRKNKTNNSMLFATDIVKTDDTSKKFFPAMNEDYPIFGHELYSPIGGQVVKIVNDIPENRPFSGGYPYNTGNTIVIRSENRYLLLGHLKMGSIRVSVNDTVSAGSIIAEAGNSGYSERPHLHMQLIDSATDTYWKGMGVSIQFRGKNLYKNRIIKILQHHLYLNA
jgi:hypothetical protein